MRIQEMRIQVFYYIQQGLLNTAKIRDVFRQKYEVFDEKIRIVLHYVFIGLQYVGI